MKILVDIGHPAHVHLFKNLIWRLQSEGHDVLITTKNKEITLELLDKYGFNYFDLGKMRKNLIQKAYGIIIFDLKLFKIAWKFKPDLFLSAGSPYSAQVSKFLRKTSIAIIDTEHANLTIKLLTLFTNVIYTPSCFKKNLGKKHIRFEGYKELAYLHPNYFVANPAVLNELGLSKDECFVILRFVSRHASHDSGHSGIDRDMKLRYVNEIKKHARVLITSEDPLPIELEQYRITVSPDKMHDLLYYSTLLLGESSTMASECAVLGTPAIFIDFAGRGYTDEQEKKYGLVYNFGTDKISLENALKKAIELLENEHLGEECENKKRKLINDKIDVTEYMFNIINNYTSLLTKQ